MSSLSSSSAVGSNGKGDTDSDKGKQTGASRGPTCRTWEEEGSLLTPKHIRTAYGKYNHNNNSILDGLWPGQEDKNLLSRFVEQHFYNNWLAYSLFEEWAVARFKVDPDSAIYVEEWMALKDDGCLAALTAKGQAKEQEVLVDKGCNKIQSLKMLFILHTQVLEDRLCWQWQHSIFCAYRSISPEN